MALLVQPRSALEYYQKGIEEDEDRKYNTKATFIYCLIVFYSEREEEKKRTQHMSEYQRKKADEKRMPF